MGYVWNIFIALSQILNALLGGFPDETTSSRLWRLDAQGSALARLARRGVDALFFWQDGHCRLSHEAERKRYQLPPVFR